MNPHGVSQTQLRMSACSESSSEAGHVLRRERSIKQSTLRRSNIMTKNKGRVVGLDVHPDSFAGAVVEGSDPAQARVLSSSTRVELEQLEQWALRHTSTEDRLVLEASGNVFAVAARLRTIGRKVEILDSHRAGKVGKVYCANDRVDAVKIARIYLSALSPICGNRTQRPWNGAKSSVRIRRW